MVKAPHNQITLSLTWLSVLDMNIFKPEIKVPYVSLEIRMLNAEKTAPDKNYDDDLNEIPWKDGEFEAIYDKLKGKYYLQAQVTIDGNQGIIRSKLLDCPKEGLVEFMSQVTDLVADRLKVEDIISKSKQSED